MKRLIPFIVAVAVFISALPLKSNAVLLDKKVKYATSVYGSNAVNSSGFLIDYQEANCLFYDRVNIETTNYTYYCDRYVVGGVVGTNSRMIILNNEEENAAHVMGTSRRLGDTALRFFCKWYYSNGFVIGFTDYNLDITPDMFSEGSLDRSIAEIYVDAKANDNHPDISKICLSVSGVTTFNTSAVNSGEFGYVYQGIITSTGSLLSSSHTLYNYNASNFTISWILFDEWGGLKSDTYSWYLYTPGYPISSFDKSGVSNEYYTFSCVSNNATYSCGITLSGLYILDYDTADQALISDLLFMLFDSETFEPDKYVWCVSATIDMNQQQQIIDSQGAIEDKLDNIYNAIVGEEVSAPSSPSEDQLVNMIDKDALSNARTQINAFDVSAYATAVSAILFINAAWANYPVFSSAIILVGVGFLIFTIINGLKKK